MHFDRLASHWDEAVPLGNGMVGALIWQKADRIRFSLDRADLWDLRPTHEFNNPNFNYKWVCEQVKNGDYGPVQKMLDEPYDTYPGPSKIPAGALEFDINLLGQVERVDLSIDSAICSVQWKNGTKLKTFVHATLPIGWFKFESLPEGIQPIIEAPNYGTTSLSKNNTSVVSGQSLSRLGYEKGMPITKQNLILYHQQAWGNLSYDIAVTWKYTDKDTLEGCWTIISQGSPYSTRATASKILKQAMRRSFGSDLKTHGTWWTDYWKSSAISIPDTLLERQWYLEQYKFGSVSRKGAPPITLQAVWTADNGGLPPWKGDFHHDLNTQLSYWPAYSSNHLQEASAFTDWLWNTKGEAEKYTKTFYQNNGLNVPGVSTLTGSPMGGWAQYAMSPTTSAWLSQYFYWQWKFSGDKVFLKKKAYPWLKAVAIHLDAIAQLDENGKRKLPLSSSPEYNDNDITAWSYKTTNYDLALIRWLYKSVGEMATALNYTDEATKWNSILNDWGDFSINQKSGGLMVTSNSPYDQSHRHFSHLLAIYPLGVIDYSSSKEDRQRIDASIAELDKFGSDYWVGYSFAWLGNLKARAFNGDGAAAALNTFAKAFCLSNSFHVNGDQSGKGFSKFTYRPFTLEGNFAFASGLQEMLLQSHTPTIQLFPALPKDWKNASFTNLRAQGAFLISAEMRNGEVRYLNVHSERGGMLRIKNPSNKKMKTTKEIPSVAKETIEVETRKGETITFSW